MTSSRVLKTQPINFALYYDGDINLYTIYLDDGYPALPLYLKIFNDSIHNIELAAPGTDNERKTKAGCHFYMTFPRGVLNLDGSQTILSDDNWKAFYVAASGGGGRGAGSSNDTIYFSRNTAGTIEGKSDQNQDLSEITLTLSNIQAKSGVQTRASEVGLYYGGKTNYKAPKASEIANTELAEHGYDHTLFIINHYGKKEIPLHAGFAGSNTILNDGQTPNQLQLQITNIQNPNNPRPNLAIGEDSRFIIRFDEGDLTKEWALAEPDKVQGIAVAAVDNTKWSANRENNSSDWIITPKKNSDGTLIAATLDLGKSIDLNITNITSGHPSGQTKLTVRYEEIPDYWDGDLVCLIEKTPLMFRSPLKATDDNQTLTAVRIKTDFNDNGKSGVKHVGLAVETGDVVIDSDLEVKGELLDLASDGAGIQFHGNAKIYKKIGSGLKIKPHNDDHGIEFLKADNSTTQMILNNGNVGIGTTSPSEKLHVEGNIKTNNAFIGSTHSEWAGFSHKDNATDGGYALLQSDSGQTLLNAASNQNIRFRINNSDKMTLDSNGKLGIGTTDPKGELHLVGNLILGNDVNNQKFIMHPRTNGSGDFLTICADKSDGDWNWDQGITLRRSGNVGIGQQSPTQKLDVNGTIKANSFDKFIFVYLIVSQLTLNQPKDYGRLRATLKINDGSGGHRVMILVEVIDTSRSIQAVLITPDMVNSNISWETKSCVNKTGNHSCELLMYGQNRGSDFYGCFVMISLNS